LKRKGQEKELLSFPSLFECGEASIWNGDLRKGVEGWNQLIRKRCEHRVDDLDKKPFPEGNQLKRVARIKVEYGKRSFYLLEGLGRT